MKIRIRFRTMALTACCLAAFSVCLPGSQGWFKASAAWAASYTVVDTGQSQCFDDSGVISAPSAGQAYYGQDAQHSGNQPSYTVSADGLTVYDTNTGLTWTKSADWSGDGIIDVYDKLTFAEAQAFADTLNAAAYGGYTDWRLPFIKELYSLINFQGTDPDVSASDSSNLTPFIDTAYFDFNYGDIDSGERIIDAQYWSATEYVSTVMDGRACAFGVNFADGRIKGYPQSGGQGEKLEYIAFCRGNTAYGVNNFVDNGDGTVTDKATGLMWSQVDSGQGYNWAEALALVVETNAQGYAGHSDWRLPNAKELQSIVDYTRSPDTTGSAAIDPIFDATAIINEGGEVDWPFYWTSTTHISSSQDRLASQGVYVAFGRGLGYMSFGGGAQAQSGQGHRLALVGPPPGNGDGGQQGPPPGNGGGGQQGPPPGNGGGQQGPPPGNGGGSDATLMDVHGAGCQRSDPKTGDPNDYPTGRGPQGDVIRIYNYVRLVRDAS